MKSRRFKATLSALLVLSMPLLPSLWAQTTDATSTNKSWKATRESQNPGNTNATRTTESHTQSGNRTVDKQSVEMLGADGRYQPFMDTEKETVQVSASTTRVVQRTFSRGPSGERVLTQVTEEEHQNLPGGEAKVMRTTSSPDVNGHLQVVQREAENTKNTGPNAQETTKTVFLPDMNGGLSAATQTAERQKRTSDQASEFQKSTLFRDGNGNMQVVETREGTVKQQGKDRTTEERVLQPGSDGKMSVISRTVSKAAEGAQGEMKETVDSYSTEIPGSSPDGNLHLNQRVITVHQARPDGGQTTQQQIEQRNPGDPSAGMRITIQTTDTVRPGARGTQETRTVQALDGGGKLSVVSVDTGKSDKPAAVKVEIAPLEKAKSTEKPK